jgi:hypothetical protein
MEYSAPPGASPEITNAIFLFGLATLLPKFFFVEIIISLKF